MTINEIEAVIKSSCPHGRKSWALAYFVGCSLLSAWRHDHRAHWMPPVAPHIIAAQSESAKRGRLRSLVFRRATGAAI